MGNPVSIVTETFDIIINGRLDTFFEQLHGIAEPLSPFVERLAACGAVTDPV